MGGDRRFLFGWAFIVATGCLPVPAEVVERALGTGNRRSSEDSELDAPVAGIESAPANRAGPVATPPLPPGHMATPSSRNDDASKWPGFHLFPGELPLPDVDRDLWVTIPRLTKRQHPQLLDQTQIYLEYAVRQGEPEAGAQYAVELLRHQFSDFEPPILARIPLDLSQPHGVIRQLINAPSAGTAFMARVVRMRAPGDPLTQLSSDQFSEINGQGLPVHSSRAEYVRWLDEQRKLVTISDLKMEAHPDRENWSIAIVDYQLNGESPGNQVYFIVESRESIVGQSLCMYLIARPKPDLEPKYRQFSAAFKRQPGPLRMYVARSRHFMGGGLVVCSNVLGVK